MRRAVFAYTTLVGVLVVAEAFAADPTKQECVAADDAAQDLRQTGKLGAARQQLAICATTSCPVPVQNDCTQRIEEIDKAQPTIVFAVKDPQGNDLSLVRVTVDGEPFAARLDGRAKRVDPGEHRFTFDDANGIAHSEKTVVVREGEKDRRVTVVLGAPAPSLHAGQAMPNGDAETGSAGAPALAYASFGLSGVGLIVGAVFTGLYLKSRSDGDAACANGCADAASRESEQKADTAGLAVGFAVAAVGAIAGIVIITTSTPPAAASAQASGFSIAPRIGFGWNGVEGRF